MNKEERIREMIQTGRNFMRPEKMAGSDLIEDYETDQNLKKPQPPLYKEPMGGKIIQLPTNYHDLTLKTDIVEILYKRKSSRVYTQEQMSLLELAYLLWATQGVKEIRGNNYATLRTVACGGARHEFECYIAVRNVEGLEMGLYHYMPDRHAVELIKEIPTVEAYGEEEFIFYAAAAGKVSEANKKEEDAFYAFLKEE